MKTFTRFAMALMLAASCFLSVGCSDADSGSETGSTTTETPEAGSDAKAEGSDAKGSDSH